MSEARWTPGPWSAVRADPHGFKDEPDRWVVVAKVDGKEYFVASIENGAPGDTLETEKNNAHLFAAAKKMYAALEQLSEALDPNRDPSKFSCKQLADIGRAALSAARGEGEG